jgi:hypothetical protein
MTGRRCSLVSGVLAGTLLLCVGVASGETPPQSIDLFVAGRSDTVAQLQGAVGAAERPMRWLSVDKIDVADVVRRPIESGQAARAWIDCSRPDRVRIYFANWSTGRFLVREVLLPDGLNELALETLGQVIETSLSALIADDKTGMSRAEITSVLERAPIIEPATSKGSSTWGARWGAFYAVQVFAPEELIEQGPGLTAALAQREGRWRPAGWISAQYQLPETIQTDLIGVRLDTIALRAGAELTRELTARVALALHIGMGPDAVHVAPRQGSTQHASLSPERFSWEYAAQFALVGTTRIDAGVVLSAALLADADLSVRHYDVIVDGSAVRALTPWRVRPGLMAGFTWP